jgi:hypothetical protein
VGGEEARRMLMVNEDTVVGLLVGALHSGVVDPKVATVRLCCVLCEAKSI